MLLEPSLINIASLSMDLPITEVYFSLNYSNLFYYTILCRDCLLVIQCPDPVLLPQQPRFNSWAETQPGTEALTVRVGPKSG